MTLRRPMLLLLVPGLLLAGCSRPATNGEIHFADGLERLALGDTAQALDLFEQARWELGNDPRVLFHIGRLQARSSEIARRVAARETLKQAIDRDPDNGLYRETLGELLQRQRFPTESTRLLHEALQLDPGLSHAWYLLGVNMQRRYFDAADVPADLDSAMNCYTHALIVDPACDEAAYNLAFLQMHEGVLEVARSLLVPIVAVRACPGRYGMLLAAVETRAKRYERAMEVLDRTLRCMGWAEREHWVGLGAILLPDSTGWWEDRTWAQQDSLSQWFWWSCDPTPTTLVNERLLEHITRVVEADFYFEVPILGKAGSSSDRGEMWLRYGQPLMAFRLYTNKDPVWRWVYGAERGRDRGGFFDFVDTYHNGDYPRVRRGAGADYSYAEVFEVVPAATRIRFPSPRGGLQYQMRYFRGSDQRTAVDIAFAVREEEVGDGLLVEAAGWRGPQDRAAARSSFTPRQQMVSLGDGRLLGRMRFEVPSEELVLGLQARPARRSQRQQAPEPTGSWIAVGRDTLAVEDLNTPHLALSDILLAYEIGEATGGPFDVGDKKVIPRIDARIASHDLNLYFEIYASEDIWRAGRPIVVRYAVRPRPARFGFWDQFKPGARSRWDPERLPTVEAAYDFEPHRPVETQSLRIDLSVLERGPYELRIELEDVVTGQVASRIVPFLLTSDTGGT